MKKLKNRTPISLNENQRRFLSLVLRRPGTRRQDIADELGFSQQTAMRTVAPLVEAGILIEINEITGSRGKPPRLVHFARSSLFTYALVIGPDRVTVSLADLEGRVLAKETERRGFTSCNEQLSTAEAVFRRIASQIPSHAHVVFGAVTASGFFKEKGRRIVSFVDIDGWAQTDLLSWVEELTQVPCVVQHDARAVALSVLETTDLRDFLCIFLDVGIGGGVIENGEPVLGRHGNAGAIGRLFPRNDERPTDASLRSALGIENWDSWKGCDQLTVDQTISLNQWLDGAVRQFNKALEFALPLLDFGTLWICSRIPEDVLQSLADRIEVFPLGDFHERGLGTKHALPKPEVRVRTIESVTEITHTFAMRTFLNVTDNRIEFAQSMPSKTKQKS